MKWFLIIGGVIVGYVVIKSLSQPQQNNTSTYIPSPVYSANLQSSNPNENLTGSVSSVSNESNNDVVSSINSVLAKVSTPNIVDNTGNLVNDVFNTINSLKGNLAQNQQMIDAQLTLLNTANTHIENLINTGGGLALALTSGITAPDYTSGANATFNPNSSGGFSVSTNYDVSNSLKEISDQLEQTKANDANVLNSTISDWQNKFNNLNDQFSATLNGNTAQIKSLNDKLNESYGNYDNLNSSYNLLNENYNNVNTNLSNLTNNYNSTKTSLDSANSQINNDRNDLNNVNNNYNNLKTNYDKVVKAFQDYVLLHR